MSGAQRSLVVVESPAKAKTIEKCLGSSYRVLACYGHVRDLKPKGGAVVPEDNFKMHYEPIERNARHVTAIIKALSKADELVLATDPDREGEAIAWHLLELLEASGKLKGKTVRRVAFHQITKRAVLAAMDSPRDLAMDLVQAQQARRALDYLVGFNLSPLCWKKIRPGLSAGRVQSPALRMIVERELEINAFESREYWSIHANTRADERLIKSKLQILSGEKLEQFTLSSEKQAKQAVAEVGKVAAGELTVSKVIKKTRKRHPAPPFITSTLQQEAARKLGFSAQKTMQIAQQLYEGISLGSDTIGLITYMRTDSVNVAQEAITEIRECIVSRYGENNCPEQVRVYKTKSKNAQEAHEAIRPTSVLHFPADIESHLTRDQFRLYQLVWKRTVASQMISATLDMVSVDLTAENHLFRATGSTITDPGFIHVYQEGVDDQALDDQEQDRMLPPLTEGQKLPLVSLLPEQHFTEPPPRFSEASLVKALEEHGIGRPSTYASIIATLKNREYVEMDKKRFFATDIGMIVRKFLSNYVPQYVDYNFTANLEDELDEVSRGEKAWIPLLEEFWAPFQALVIKIDKDVKRSDVTQEPIDEKCPKCEAGLSIRLGKRGRFVGCSGFPECDYTRNIDGSPEESTEPEMLDRTCPECESPLLMRSGRYGKFIGCSGYPKCRFIESAEKPKATDVTCPLCHTGNIVERRSRRGKVFFSCERYPKCDYALWDEPLAEACPSCQWSVLGIKETKRSGREKVCPQKNCDYRVSFPKEDSDDDS